MTRKGDLERLVELRSLRLDRAHRALAQQSAAIAAADQSLAEATAAAIANADRRGAREGQLFDRLAMRPLTGHEISRAHEAIEGMERQAETLDEAEQQAFRALDAEKARHGELDAERRRLERERDKLTAVAAAQGRVAARRAELIAELDADGEPGARRAGPFFAARKRSMAVR